MDRQQIALKLVLEHMGLGVKLDSFDDRLITQKAVYLAQAGGINLGYYYQWYLRGPYAPSLTRDAFTIDAASETDKQESSRWSMDPESLRKISELRELVPENEKARMLELLASVHFLIDRAQTKADDVAGIGDTLRRYGKNFTSDEVREALRELRAHGLLK